MSCDYKSIADICQNIEREHEEDTTNAIPLTEIQKSVREDSPHSVSETLAAIRENGWDDDERSAYVSLDDYQRHEATATAEDGGAHVREHENEREHASYAYDDEDTSLMDVFRQLRDSRTCDYAFDDSDAPNAGLCYAFYIPHDIRQSNREWYFNDGARDAKSRVNKQAKRQLGMHDRRVMHASEEKARSVMIESRARAHALDDKKSDSSEWEDDLVTNLLPKKFKALAYS